MQVAWKMDFSKKNFQVINILVGGKEGLNEGCGGQIGKGRFMSLNLDLGVDREVLRQGMGYVLIGVLFFGCLLIRERIYELCVQGDVDIIYVFQDILRLKGV